MTTVPVNPSSNTDLSDSNDGTYVTAAYSTWKTYDMGTVALSGAAIVSLVPKIRARVAVGGPCKVEFGLSTGTGAVRTPTTTAPSAGSMGTTVVEYTGAAVSGAGWTQSMLDGLKFWFRKTGTSISGDDWARVTKVWVDVIYAGGASVVVDDLGTVATFPITATWTATTDSAATSYAGYELKVYTPAQYSAVGFSPDTTPPLYTTGVVNSGVESATISTAFTGAARIYVRIKQTVGGSSNWSPWDYGTVTSTWVTADVDTVTAVPDSGNGRIAVAVTRDTGTDDWAFVEVDRIASPNLVEAYSTIVDTTPVNGLADTWVAMSSGSPTSASRTVGSASGVAYQRFTATLDANDQYGARLGAATHAAMAVVQPGQTLQVILRARGTVNADTALRVRIDGWNDVAEVVSITNNFAMASASLWQTVAFSRAVPAGCTYLSVAVLAVGLTGAAADTVNIDVADQPYVGVEDWVPVRGAAATPVEVDDATVYDYEAPSATDVHYRARAVSATAVPSDWAYSTATQWAANGCWLKSPDAPQLNMPIVLFKLPVSTRSRSFGNFYPLEQSLAVGPADVLRGRTGELAIATRSMDEAFALERLVDTSPFLLVQFPAAWGRHELWIATAGLGEIIHTRIGDMPYRRWTLPYTQTRPPAVL